MAKIAQSFLAAPSGRYVVMLVIGGALVGLLWSSFAEKTTWAYFVLAVMALIPIALFLTNRRVDHLLGLAIIALLMGGVYVADRYQETDREHVLRKTNELLRAVEQADFNVFERHLGDDFRWQGSDKRALMNGPGRQALPTAGGRTCGLASGKVTGQNGESRLVVEGNLVATGQYGSQDIGVFSGVLELTFSRGADGQYRVSGVRVLRGDSEVTIPR